MYTRNPLLTPDLIASANQYVGKSNFRGLLNALKAARAFGKATTDASISALLYEQDIFMPEAKNNWATGRFHDTTNGTRSTTNVEAEFYMQAARRAFGDKIAYLISEEELVSLSFSEILSRLAENLSTSRVDPVVALKGLVNTDGGLEIFADGSRFGGMPGHPDVEFNLENVTVVKRAVPIVVRVKTADPKTTIVLEYAVRSAGRETGSGALVRAQSFTTFQQVSAGSKALEVRHAGGEALLSGFTPQLYGFCAISGLPQKVIDTVPSRLSDEELTKIVATLVSLSIDNKIRVSDLGMLVT